MEKNDVFFVSVLWVDSCMKSWQRVDEKLFPASKNDSDSPMSSIQGKLKRLKSMQPKPFEEDLNHSGSKWQLIESSSRFKNSLLGILHINMILEFRFVYLPKTLFPHSGILQASRNFIF